MITFYYRHVFNSLSLAGRFYRIGVPQIKDILIALADDIKISRLEKLVDEVINNNNEQKRKKVLNEIDLIVYEIYDLSNDEINIVEAMYR